MHELMIRNRKRASGAQEQPMLALLFYHMNGVEEGLAQLRSLSEHNVQVQLCPDDTILRHYSTKKLTELTGVQDIITLTEAERRKEEYQHIHIPILSFSAVSDLLRFNDARESINLLMWTLMSGKKVSAWSQGADPFAPIWEENGLNHGSAFLKHELKKQLQQLRGLGVQLIKSTDDLLKDLKKANKSGTPAIITAETIKSLAEAGTAYIDVGQGTIITPLARDIAKEYQIKLGE